ncbi:MAG: hypothetical protein PHC51_04485 [bacterium]|nr:hypothetical protein [bacterium]
MNEDISNNPNMAVALPEPGSIQALWFTVRKTLREISREEIAPGDLEAGERLLSLLTRHKTLLEVAASGDQQLGCTANEAQWQYEQVLECLRHYLQQYADIHFSYIEKAIVTVEGNNVASYESVDLVRLLSKAIATQTFLVNAGEACDRPIGLYKQYAEELESYIHIYIQQNNDESFLRLSRRIENDLVLHNLETTPNNVSDFSAEREALQWLETLQKLDSGKSASDFRHRQLLEVRNSLARALATRVTQRLPRTLKMFKSHEQTIRALLQQGDMANATPIGLQLGEDLFLHLDIFDFLGLVGPDCEACLVIYGYFVPVWKKLNSYSQQQKQDNIPVNLRDMLSSLGFTEIREFSKTPQQSHTLN